MSYEYLEKRFQKLDALGGSRKKRIYLVKDKVTGQVVVLKYIPKENAAIYKNLKKIHHANVVHILFVAEGKKDAIVIMEYIGGRTLADYCEEKGKISEEEALDIVAQIVEGLCAVHQQQLIHRDIKPDNIMISFDGVVKIIDFDICRIYKKEKKCDTQYLGTEGYAAPEQYGYLQSDARADIYSVGAVLNVMLTGKIPREYCYEKGRLGKVIHKCTEMERNSRYRSAEELLKVIRTIYVQKKRAEKIINAIVEFFPEDPQEREAVIKSYVSTTAMVLNVLWNIQKDSKGRG